MSNAAWGLVVAGIVVWAFWYFHETAPKGQQGRSAQDSKVVLAKCDEQAKKVLKKIGSFKFSRPAHIDYIDAFDFNNKKIGLVVLAQEPTGGRVTLRGAEYARLPDTNGEYVGDYAVDMARHSTHTSSKDFLERICRVDPANEWIHRDPQAIKAELVAKFGMRS